MESAAAELFAPTRVVVEHRSGGALITRSADELGRYAPSMAHLFRANAGAHPERPLAAERDGRGWRTLTWGEARRRADALAQALLDRGLRPDRPLMILSENSLAHLSLTLGAFTAGVPVIPVSVAYSTLTRDHERIREIADRCRPGLVFAEDAARFGAALDALRPVVPTQVVATGDRPGAEPLDALAATTPADDVARAFDALGPETVAKVLWTSGSTGAPKGVVNTHRMLCSNQQALGQVWPFMTAEPPVLVDWLPWSHTFGGNHNLGQVLAFGGTIHIDDGKPVPELFERTIEALAMVPPTVYYNVPAGFALLTPRLEQDRAFAARFLSRLRFLFYAAAALPESLWDRLQAVVADVADRPIPLTASWGTTETAPGATTAHFAHARCGCIGVPLPGVTLKLIPRGASYEIRLKGPNVTPGYHDDPAATALAFDRDGFYRTGDAVRPVDPGDLSQGLLFDGRLAENFKLLTGTWVMVGPLRTALLSACEGVLSNAVIAGQDRGWIGALGWIDQAAARRRCAADADLALDDPRLHRHLRDGLERLNAGAGSASRIDRVLLLDAPPSLDAGELTDKGYVNQRAVLRRRAEAVDRLYAEAPGPDVVVVAS